MQVEADRSQDLANLVVQFAGDVLALGFLCLQQTPRVSLQSFLVPLALGYVSRRTLDADCHSVLIDHATTYFHRLAGAILSGDLSFVSGFDRSVQLNAKALARVFEMFGSDEV